jgi:hypothetical protein
MIDFLKFMPSLYVVRGVGNCNLMIDFHYRKCGGVRKDER